MIDYEYILQHFLNCNKNIKLKFRDDEDILDVFSNTQIITSISLDNKDIKSNSNIIYNSIIKLDDITMYIPKIYTR